MAALRPEERAHDSRARCVSNSYKNWHLVHRRCPHRLKAGPRQPPCPGSIDMVYKPTAASAQRPVSPSAAMA
eukprot:2432834-Prymnesium_polylepis.1